jgi:hypothetical protein
VPGLSPTFLVWDPDMVVLWPMQVLGPRSAVSGTRQVVRQVGGVRHQGRPVQVEPMNPMLKSPGTNRLKP